MRFIISRSVTWLVLTVATLDCAYSSKGGALVEKLRNLFFCRFAYLRWENGRRCRDVTLRGGDKCCWITRWETGSPLRRHASLRSRNESSVLLRLRWSELTSFSWFLKDSFPAVRAPPLQRQRRLNTSPALPFHSPLYLSILTTPLETSSPVFEASSELDAPARKATKIPECLQPLSCR